MPCDQEANAFCAAMLKELKSKDTSVPIHLDREERLRIAHVIRENSINRMGGLEHFGCTAVVLAEQVFDRFYTNSALINADGRLVFVPVRKRGDEIYRITIGGVPYGEPLRNGEIIAINRELVSEL